MFLLTGLALVASATPAHAADCAPLSPAEFADRASALHQLVQFEPGVFVHDVLELREASACLTGAVSPLTWDSLVADAITVAWLEGRSWDDLASGLDATSPGYLTDHPISGMPRFTPSAAQRVEVRPSQDRANAWIDGRQAPTTALVGWHLYQSEVAGVWTTSWSEGPLPPTWQVQTSASRPERVAHKTAPATIAGAAVLASGVLLGGGSIVGAWTTRPTEGSTAERALPVTEIVGWVMAGGGAAAILAGELSHPRPQGGSVTASVHAWLGPGSVGVWGRW